MARFKITEPVLKTVEAGKQNAGNKYLVAKLVNTLCIWEEPTTFTCFIKHLVNAWTALLPIAKGGTAQAEQPIPDELAYVTGCYVEYIPEQKFFKQHLSSHEARPATTTQAARPAIRAGELVKKGDQPIIYSKLEVFCLYYIDEMNQKQWVKGSSPETAGQRAFSAYCIPIQEDKTAQTMPAGNQPEIIEDNTVNTVTPKPQFDPNTGQPIIPTI